MIAPRGSQIKRMSRMKYGLFIILLALATLAGIWFFHHGGRILEAHISDAVARPSPGGDQNGGYGDPETIADLKDRSVSESSGLAASRRNPGIIWTHNDSGDGPLVYAFDLKGAKKGVWRLAGARARDWEDMAVGPGPKRGVSYLYLGDIGNNERKPRELVIYRVAEPKVATADASSTKVKPRLTGAVETLRLAYPQGAFDAEALLVHPSSGDLYIVTKRSSESTSAVFKADAPLRPGPAGKLVRVARLALSSPPFDFIAGKITGGDIAPDGSRLILCDYLQGYELLLPSRTNFDAIWKQTPARIKLGTRRQGEAIGYSADGKSILATSEGSPCPLIRVSLIE